MSDKAGVSKAQADAHRRTLAALLREEPNRRCAECGARGPTWASVNLGVFVCLNCSGEREWREGAGVSCDPIARFWTAAGCFCAWTWAPPPRAEATRPFAISTCCWLVGGIETGATMGQHNDARPMPLPFSPTPPHHTGVHRSLGTHVSKVRSATLDTWLPDQVAFVAATGNARAASFWEAKLPPGFARPAEGDMAALARFIGDKYREKRYAAEGVPPTLENGVSAGAAAPPAPPAAAPPPPARPAAPPVADLLCLDDGPAPAPPAAAAAATSGGGWASFDTPAPAAAAAAPAPAAPAADPHGWDAFVAASVAPTATAPPPPAAVPPPPAMPRAPRAPPVTRADHAAILSLFDAAPAATEPSSSGGGTRGGPLLPAPGGPGWP